MNKFNVGDVVKVLAEDDITLGCMPNYIGKTGEVVEFWDHMADGLLYGVDFTDNLFYYRPESLELVPTKNKYSREIKPDTYVDVYDVLTAFNVTNPAIAHAVKKLLACGVRGHKDTVTDMEEAITAIQRGIEIYKEANNEN